MAKDHNTACEPQGQTFRFVISIFFIYWIYSMAFFILNREMVYDITFLTLRSYIQSPDESVLNMIQPNISLMERNQHVIVVMWLERHHGWSCSSPCGGQPGGNVWPHLPLCLPLDPYRFNPVFTPGPLQIYPCVYRGASPRPIADWGPHPPQISVSSGLNSTIADLSIYLSIHLSIYLSIYLSI